MLTQSKTIGNGLAIPQRWLAETESTNDVARDWALAGAPAGAVVVAGHQTRGRQGAGTGLTEGGSWPTIRTD